jgi:catechol 2,3-dioxygenase-like lactoylglutathione lyase family enzyme
MTNSTGTDNKIRIRNFDHVGIRVTDRGRALAFYQKLGFEVDPEFSNDRVAEVINEDGIRLNLIFNGVSYADNKNVLLDLSQRWPGYTHAAFIVKKLADIVHWAEKNHVAITEGPVDWGRRLTCFLRDPDGNVLEFNELKR